MIYKYIVRIPPITKKNSQRILINQKTRKPFIAQSAAYKRYEAAALYAGAALYLTNDMLKNLKTSN